MQHNIKTQSKYFNEAISGEKPFTIRRDDRGYKVGDILHKIEIANDYKGEPDSQFVDPFKVAQCWKPTGREADFVITYKLDGGQFGLEKGYCILGLRPLEQYETIKQLLKEIDDEIQECVDDWDGETDEAYNRAVSAREYAFRQARRMIISTIAFRVKV